MVNRIARSVELVNGMIQSAEPHKLAEMDEKFRFSLEEYVLLQEKKSLAQAMGRITFDEAQTIYAYCGNSPDTLNGQSLAVRVALTKLLAELIRPNHRASA
jgi:hypothetical protein